MTLDLAQLTIDASEAQTRPFHDRLQQQTQGERVFQLSELAQAAHKPARKKASKQRAEV